MGVPTKVELHFLDPDGNQIELVAWDYPRNDRAWQGQYDRGCFNTTIGIGHPRRRGSCWVARVRCGDLTAARPALTRPWPYRTASGLLDGDTKGNGATPVLSCVAEPGFRHRERLPFSLDTRSDDACHE